MAGMGQTLTQDAGPLPVWAWAGIGTAAIAGFLIYRKKQSMNAASAAATNQADSSNLGTTPVSNLSVGAEPMPIQLGDTFINNQPPANNTTVNNPVTVNNPPAGSLPTPPKPNPPPPPATAGNGPQAGPASVLNKEMGGGTNLTYVSTPALAKQLYAKGYNIYTIGNADYYNPAQQLTGSPMDLIYVPTPAQAQADQKAGKKLITIGRSQWIGAGQ